MKTVFFLASLFLNINVYAFTQNATLDFTHLYNKTNAGLYEMSVIFTPKTTMSLSGLEFRNYRQDNDLYCISEARFEIGQMNFTLKARDKNWSYSAAKTVEATLTYQSPDENCMTDINQFTGLQKLYATIGLNQPIELPVKAPFDYEKVAAYLSPFNGYLYLQTTIKNLNGQLAVDPSELLTHQSISAQNTQNASVTYYVFAVNQATTLSLGTGLIRF